MPLIKQINLDNDGVVTSYDIAADATNVELQSPVTIDEQQYETAGGALEAAAAAINNIEIDIADLGISKIGISQIGMPNGVASLGNDGKVSSSQLPEIPTKVSELQNDSGYITGYTETDPTVPAQAKASTKPSYTASEVGAVATTAVGSANGVAELDSNGKVPAAQLPSFVDEIIEGYLNPADGKFYEESTYETEILGEEGKIYTELATNKTYRQSGSAFVEISESIALGETSSTAYAGNKGKANADAIAAIKDGTNIDSFSDVETALGDYMKKGVDYVTAGHKAGTTLGSYVTTEGINTTASGYAGHAEGSNTAASASCAHAEGDHTIASHSYSHAEGSYTKTGNSIQHVSGKYNEGKSDTAFEIGNGTAENARSNAFEVDWSGNVTAYGDVASITEIINFADVAQAPTINKINIEVTVAGVVTVDYMQGDNIMSSNTYNLIAGHTGILFYDSKTAKTRYISKGETELIEFSTTKPSIKIDSVKMSIVGSDIKAAGDVIDGDGNILADMLGISKVGIAGGVASLDEDGKVPSSQLPETITVDDAMSDASTNPVQNKVITEALDGKANVERISGYGNVQNVKTWSGLTNFNGSHIWTDGDDIYYSYGSSQYVLNKSTSTWSAKTWNGFTSLRGKYIWTDGDNIYYSFNDDQYVLDKATSTWNTKTWLGVTPFAGNTIWKDGNNIYYSNDESHYVLNKETSTWETKTWSGLSSFYGFGIWTDGTDIYYSYVSSSYVLNRATSTWEAKTWTSSVQISADYIWSDGGNIYYSMGSIQYILDKSTSTWNTKTWNGLTNFNGDSIWSDGTDIYYSSSTTHYILDNLGGTVIEDSITIKPNGDLAAAGDVTDSSGNVLRNKLNSSDISAWAKASTKPTYTAAEVGAVSTNNFQSDANTTRNANDITKNTIGYFNAGGPPSSATDGTGSIYSQVYSVLWENQIAQDFYNNGHMAVRSKRSGTWGSQERVPTVQMSTTDISAGSTLPTGQLYVVYEA